MDFKIGSAISTFISTTVSKLGPVFTVAAKILPVISPAIQVVSVVAEVVLRALEIIKPNESLDQLGDKAIQAAAQGITADAFDSYDEYMEKIRNFEVKPEESAKIDDDAKRIAGLMVGTKAMDYKLNIPDGSAIALLALAAQDNFFDTKRTEAIARLAPADMLNVIQYFNDNTELADTRSAEKTLLKLEQTVTPGSDEATVYQKLDEVKQAVKNRR